MKQGLQILSLWEDELKPPFLHDAGGGVNFGSNLCDVIYQWSLGGCLLLQETLLTFVLIAILLFILYLQLGI